MKEIPLTQGKVALVDDEDYEWLMQWKWCFHSGYAIRNRRKDDGEGSKHIYMHREINKTPPDLRTDHINGVRTDNRKCNLRNVTMQENNMNRGKPNKDNFTSVYKGVFWYNGFWVARIMINRKSKHLGKFTNEIACANCYNHHAKNIFGEFAYLNECPYISNWSDYQYVFKKNTSSKYRGVYWSKKDKKWVCKIYYKGKNYNIGYYKDENEAGSAYNKKAIELYGKDYDKLNHIEEELINE